MSLDEKEQLERYDRWQHTASMSALIANIYRDTEKRKEPFTPQDFMPVSMPGVPVPKQPVEKKQSWQKQLQIVEILNAALGGEDTRG